MPTLTDALLPEGALVQILVGLDMASIQKLRTALRPLPPPIGVRALIDTGAESTCVDPSLVQMLRLPVAGSTFANLPAHGGLKVNMQYDASVTIVHPSGNPRDSLVVKRLSVLDVPLAYLGYQALLGRDLLAWCRFVYDGPANKFELAY